MRWRLISFTASHPVQHLGWRLLSSTVTLSHIAVTLLSFKVSHALSHIGVTASFFHSKSPTLGWRLLFATLSHPHWDDGFFRPQSVTHCFTLGWRLLSFTVTLSHNGVTASFFHSHPLSYIGVTASFFHSQSPTHCSSLIEIRERHFTAQSLPILFQGTSLDNIFNIINIFGRL